ncbi:hypothetical protein BLX88_06430, partial [Bacillus obstructivus]
MEPDAFMIGKRAPFCVEIQRSVYSDKMIKEKSKRYEDYYFCEEWKEEPGQPQNKKVFPTVFVLTNTRYNFDSQYIKFIQVSCIDELIKLS